jgi:hypothetical protein
MHARPPSRIFPCMPAATQRASSQRWYRKAPWHSLRSPPPPPRPCTAQSALWHRLMSWHSRLMDLPLPPASEANNARVNRSVISAIAFLAAPVRATRIEGRMRRRVDRRCLTGLPRDKRSATRKRRWKKLRLFVAFEDYLVELYVRSPLEKRGKKHHRRPRVSSATEFFLVPRVLTQASEGAHTLASLSVERGRWRLEPGDHHAAEGVSSVRTRSQPAEGDELSPRSYGLLPLLSAHGTRCVLCISHICRGGMVA